MFKPVIAAVNRPCVAGGFEHLEAAQQVTYTSAVDDEERRPALSNEGVLNHAARHVLGLPRSS